MEKVIFSPLYTVHWIILQCIFLGNVNALYCRNCTRIGKLNSGIETDCHTDCEGDVCGIVQWRKNEKIHIYESCISGVDLTGVKMGCRRNNAGATLCLCRDFHECNDIAWREKLAQMLAINLPNLECFSNQQTTNDTISIDINILQKCKANFCFYEQFTGNEEGSVASLSCGAPSQYLFDIDLFPNWPMPAMFSGECFLVESEVANPILRCMCNQDNCNDKPLYNVTPGNVTCVVYDTDTNSDAGSCRGHFCFIQRSYPPYFKFRESKGCISIRQTDYLSRIKVGYQNILGLEQWLCADDYCNVDVNEAGRSGTNSVTLKIFTTDPKFMLLLFVILTSRNTSQFF